MTTKGRKTCRRISACMTYQLSVPVGNGALLLDMAGNLPLEHRSQPTDSK